jgi:hypothetical protein
MYDAHSSYRVQFPGHPEYGGKYQQHANQLFQLLHPIFSLNHTILGLPTVQILVVQPNFCPWIILLFSQLQ